MVGPSTTSLPLLSSLFEQTKHQDFRKMIGRRKIKTIYPSLTKYKVIERNIRMKGQRKEKGRGKIKLKEEPCPYFNSVPLPYEGEIEIVDDYCLVQWGGSCYDHSINFNNIYFMIVFTLLVFVVGCFCRNLIRGWILFTK